MLKTTIIEGKRDWLLSLKYLVIIVSVIGSLLVINHFFFKIAIVNGLSMSPTLENGRIVLVKINDETLNRGDIVILDAKSISTSQKYWIKRVIGVGGDVVEINYDANTVTVNCELLEEPYINRDNEDCMRGEGDLKIVEYRVPYGYVFVMGDNRNYSQDSRDPTIGFILRSEIIGTIMIP